MKLVRLHLQVNHAAKILATPMIVGALCNASMLLCQINTEGCNKFLSLQLLVVPNCGKLAMREQRVYIYLPALLKPPQVSQSSSSANPP